jgi:broad specificity phosphatase PhoE
MVEIILARHGETEWNRGEIFRGRADVELNDVGVRQAELLAEYLAAEEIDFIYSSPLKRAVRTAQAVAGLKKLDVSIVQNLNDIDYGEWQGLSRREVKEKYPEIYRDWLDTPEQVRIPGGESLEEVRSRAMPFVEDAVMRCGEGRIVFVSHRVVNKVLICALLGLDNSYFWQIRQDTGGITRFDCEEGRLVMTSHNDTSYLRSIKGVRLADF